MSFCNLTDDLGNTYLLSAGHRFQPADPGEYLEAIKALERIDRDQLFSAEQEIFHFHNFELQQQLETRLGKSWQYAHETGLGLHSPAGSYPGRWAIILDAIYHGDLRFTKIASAPEAEAGPEEDNRGILRVKIRQALAAVVAQERAEAARHERLLGEEIRINRAAIYTGAFLTGLWNSGTDLARWLKDVNDVINPLHRSLRGIHSSYRALRRNSETGEDLLTAFGDEVLTAEKRELVQVLGFDPSTITREQFHQATEMADLIWEDPALQADIRRFVKDYVKAQHPIEITEFSGAAAFEVLFTILLAAVTAGAGLAASAAGQARHFAKFRKVGDLLMEFAEQVKKVRQRLKQHSATRNAEPKRSFDELPSEEASDHKIDIDDSGQPSEMRSKATHSGKPSLDDLIIQLRDADGDEAKIAARKIAEMSTHANKNSDRVVLGRWAEDGGYIAEAKENGGVWYETDPDFFSKLTDGLSESAGRSKAWQVNKQFLQSQLEKGVGRIDLTGESIKDVLINRPNSFTAMEIKFLEKNAGNYGYIREGNSWIKVK